MQFPSRLSYVLDSVSNSRFSPPRFRHFRYSPIAVVALKSVKYEQKKKDTWCPGHQESQLPGIRHTEESLFAGVRDTRELRLPVSLILGCCYSWCPGYQGVGFQLFRIFIKLQAIAIAFKATIDQRLSQTSDFTSNSWYCVTEYLLFSDILSLDHKFADKYYIGGSILNRRTYAKFLYCSVFLS